MLSYFYTESYRKYSCARFGLADCSYSIDDCEHHFDAIILHVDRNVGVGRLSYLPLPFYRGIQNAKRLKSFMRDYIDNVSSFGLNRIAIRQDPLIAYDDGIIRGLLSAQFTPFLFYTTIIDLTQDELVLWRNVRSRYHSLIRAKEKNSDINLSVIDCTHNCDKTTQWLDLYSELIARGGKTLSTDCREAIVDSVNIGNSIIYLLHKGDALLAGAHFDVNGNLAYYSASGIKPELEHTEPFTHFVMWRAILDLKQRGYTKLEIGPIFYDSVRNFYKHSEKEVSISQFKLGLGGKLTPFHIFVKKNQDGDRFNE
jgi:hypothetical protein